MQQSMEDLDKLMQASVGSFSRLLTCFIFNDVPSTTS
jgi:hypothetical protein